MFGFRGGGIEDGGNDTKAFFLQKPTYTEMNIIIKYLFSLLMCVCVCVENTTL